MAVANPTRAPRPSRGNGQPMVLGRIVRTPDGEAPLWVREAWVGLILPGRWSNSAKPARGLMTGRDRAVEAGFHVAWDLAIGTLRRQGHHEAADWWVEHRPGGRAGLPQLVFAPTALKPVRKRRRRARPEHKRSIPAGAKRGDSRARRTERQARSLTDRT